jgi:hypothetical protein
MRDGLCGRNRSQITVKVEPERKRSSKIKTLLPSISGIRDKVMLSFTAVRLLIVDD